MALGRVIVSRRVMAGLEAVRLSGRTNMLDARRVASLALEMGFSRTARWIKKHKKPYAEGVLKGFDVASTYSEDPEHMRTENSGSERADNECADN